MKLFKGVCTRDKSVKDIFTIYDYNGNNVDQGHIPCPSVRPFLNGEGKCTSEVPNQYIISLKAYNNRWRNYEDDTIALQEKFKTLYGAEVCT